MQLVQTSMAVLAVAAHWDFLEMESNVMTSMNAQQDLTLVTLMQFVSTTKAVTSVCAMLVTGAMVKVAQTLTNAEIKVTLVTRPLRSAMTTLDRMFVFVLMDILATGQNATMWMNALKVNVIRWPLVLTPWAVSLVRVMKDMKDLESSARILTNAVKELTAVTQQLGVRTQLDLTSVWTAQQAMSVMAPTVWTLTSVKCNHTTAMPPQTVWISLEASVVLAKLDITDRV